MKLIEPPSYTLLYNCVLNIGFISIDYGGEHLYPIAEMNFALGSCSKNMFTFHFNDEEIEKLKAQIFNQPTELDKLNKVLSLIGSHVLH